MVLRQRSTLLNSHCFPCRKGRVSLSLFLPFVRAKRRCASKIGPTPPFHPQRVCLRSRTNPNPHHPNTWLQSYLTRPLAVRIGCRNGHDFCYRIDVATKTGMKIFVGTKQYNLDPTLWAQGLPESAPLKRDKSLPANMNAAMPTNTTPAAASVCGPTTFTCRLDSPVPAAAAWRS